MKYKGKTLEVTGKIESIAEVFGTIQVDLVGVNFATVKCNFLESEAASVATLKNGQIATLVGTGDGMTANLYAGLTDCYIKQKK